MEESLLELFLNGNLFLQNNIKSVDTFEWNKHPQFKGVFLKHLVTGVDTNNKFSCHLVKVEAGCCLDEHAHSDKWEIHEIIAGEGSTCIGESSVKYEPGMSAIIPEGIKHKVNAGSKGLSIKAKFIPALI